MTGRHLDGLIDDANATLAFLTSLSDSFQAVDTQTSTFQAQCEDLLDEQKRLQRLMDEVGTDLYYYVYIDTATRRLNAPGASRLVDDDEFGEMIENLNSCVEFMKKHVSLLSSPVFKILGDWKSPTGPDGLMIFTFNRRIPIENVIPTWHATMHCLPRRFTCSIMDSRLVLKNGQAM